MFSIAACFINVFDARKNDNKAATKPVTTKNNHNLRFKKITTGISKSIVRIFGIALLKKSNCISKIPSTHFVIFFTNCPESESR